MMMYMYSVEDKNGQPRQMFSSLDTAKANRQPLEYVVEYRFTLDDSETIVFPSNVTLDFGEE